STSSPTTNSASVNSSLISASWLTGFHLNSASDLNNVSYSKYTHLTYSFAEPTENGTLSLAGSNGDLLPQFVSLAQQNGVKAFVSIGGWYGGRFFSNLVADANRSAFVQTVANFASNNKLDGIEIDWEYPGEVGACNANTPTDTANLLSFFQELRATPAGQKLILTAAAPGRVWETNGNNTLLTGFADVLDYISIMNYDLYGTFTSTAGPNAPLDDACDPTNPQGSARAAVQAWTGAGIPASKLVLGVPSYAHTFSVAPANASADGFATLATHPAFDAAVFPLGGEDDPAAPTDPATAPRDVCGQPELPSGVWEYKQLVSSGFVNADGSLAGASGVHRFFDNCSQTPILYNETSQEWISYDDPQSFAAKGKFVVQNGLAGFGMYEAADDTNDALLDAIRGGMGL
ncbi:glycoside hydrolase superfamily, partial [Vararia minispora EC-137]